MPVWLERFALVVLAAAFTGIVIFNTLKMDGTQRAGLGIAIVGLTIFIAQTIHLFNQSKTPKPIAPSPIVVPELPKESLKKLSKEPPNKPTPKPTAPVKQPVQDIHRPQQETIASIIKSGIPSNEPVLVLAATTPEQLDTFARKITAALQMGGMKAELGTSNSLRPGIVIQYREDKKAYADTILDAFTKARVPVPIIMTPLAQPPQPLTIVISSTD